MSVDSDVAGRHNARMDRIRVLEVTEAAGGGVLRHLLDIAEHIDRTEFALTFALSPRRMRDPDRVRARLLDARAAVEFVPMARRISPVNDLLAYRRLLGLMREGEYDVVHAHSSKAGMLARRAARQLGMSRVFYSPHAFAFQCGGPAGRLYAALERFAAGYDSILVAVSQSERETAVRNRIAPADRVCVIPNAVAAPGVPTGEEREAARVALRLPRGGSPVVGTVGRLARQKGIDAFLHAATRVVRARPDANFVVIGNGPEKDSLERLADSLGLGRTVSFAGYRDDAADLCAAFDVYCQLSRWEGLPYALLDAMGRAIPVVASPIPGNTDLIENGQTGLLARRATEAGEAILALIDDRERADRLGRAGRRLVLDCHALPDFIERLSALYRGELHPARHP